MSATHENEPYRLPRYDGLEYDWLEGWTPPAYPDILPPAAMPQIPVVPGFPWWVDPRMLPTPQPQEPEPLQDQAPSTPESLLDRIPNERAAGLRDLIRDAMLRREMRQATWLSKPLTRRSASGELMASNSANGRDAEAVGGEIRPGRQPVAGLVSGRPMRHFMIPIFDI